MFCILLTFSNFKINNSNYNRKICNLPCPLLEFKIFSTQVFFAYFWRLEYTFYFILKVKTLTLSPEGNNWQLANKQQGNRQKNNTENFLLRVFMKINNSVFSYKITCFILNNDLTHNSFIIIIWIKGYSSNCTRLDLIEKVSLIIIK